VSQKGDTVLLSIPLSNISVVKSAVLRSHGVCASVRLWRWWIRIT